MTYAPHAAFDPFARTVRGIVEPKPVHAELRALGPLVRVDAPAGGSAWIVTADALAREVLADPRIVKDPAMAPEGWDQRSAGLEQPAAVQLSLTTLDGPDHAELRRAHSPLLSARRMLDHSARTAEIARELLTVAAGAGTVDLMDDFTTRFPLAVLFDLLGVPADRIEQATAACRRMTSGDLTDIGPAIGEFMDVAAASLQEGRHGLATELRDHLPDAVTEPELRYLLFGLIFAGQLTTDAALGFLVATILRGEGDVIPADDLVREVLRRHPPAPFTLWRFTGEDVELGGVRLPARSPILIDILGINTAPDRPDGPDLTFGAGAHFCIGAQLARIELRAVVEVLRADFPDARLAVPFAELRQADIGDIQGSRLTALPVALCG